MTTTNDIDKLISNVRTAQGDLFAALEALAVEVDVTSENSLVLSVKQRATVRDIVADLTDGTVESHLDTLRTACELGVVS